MSFKSNRKSAYAYSWQVADEVSPDQELYEGGTLKGLRSKSKQLLKDDAIASMAQQAYISAIGSPVEVDSHSENRIQRSQVKEVLEVLQNVDVTLTKSVFQIVEEIVSASFADGDVLVSLPLTDSREPDAVRTVVDVIEAYRVDTPIDKTSDPTVSHGVQYKADGSIQGYWVRKADRINKYRAVSPEDYDFYPMFREYKGFKRRVAYLFKAPLASRPKMSRQYPILTPIIPVLKLLDDYLEAIIVGARVAACFSAFVKSKNPIGTYKGFTSEADIDPLDSSGSRRVHKLQPGSIFYLKNEEDIDFASPNRPGDNSDAFILRIQKLISANLRIPYPILFLDLSETNYSSWKGGLNEMRKMVTRWRRELTKLVTWIVNTIVLEAIVSGQVRGSVLSAKISLRWPTFGVIDPEKEGRANQYKLRNATHSRQQLCAEEGIDYEDMQKEREEDALRQLEIQARELVRKKELEEEHGIIFPEDEEKGREGKHESLTDDEKKDVRKDQGNW